MREIQIEIDKETWQFKIEAFGYYGSECVKDLDSIINKLKGITLDRKMKPEMLYAKEVKVTKCK